MNLVARSSTDAGGSRVAPGGTSSRGTRILGAVTFAGLVVLAILALVVTPADEKQGDAVRLLYLHVGSALTAFLAFGVTALASLVYLRKRTIFWDTLAAASAEVGVVLTGLCLISGALWGRPVWGVYWTWDARLTSTALMFVLFCGYLALRRVLVGSPSRGKWSAIAALIAAVDVPIVHYSTSWWQTLHQGPTISRLNPEIDGLMLFTLMFSMVVFTLLYWWLVIHRFRVEYLDTQYWESGLDQALAERRAEAGADVDVPGPSGDLVTPGASR